MILYPKLYLNSVKDITLEILNKYNIQGIILDVDNTLIDYNKNMPNGVKEWAISLKQKNIKLYIVSNSNNKDKVETVAKMLDIPYIYFAKKPFKSGLNKAKQNMDLPSKQIAVVGDQIFTDILGANRTKMFPILVKPIDEKDIWITKIKRPIEIKIIQKYLKRN